MRLPPHARLTTLWHDSSRLRGNPLGDPHVREVVILHPPGVDPSAPCPAALALAGFTGGIFSFLNRRWREESLPERLDRLTRAGMPPLRVVIPDPLTRLGGGQFLDSPGTGDYASWLVEELMPAVEAQHPTAETGPPRWGVFGKSSGGYGALMLPTLFPGRFLAAAAHSPDAAFDVAYPPDFPSAVEAIRDAGGVAGWLSAFEAGAGLKGADHAVLNLLGMSLVYSPEPGAAPLPCALPVDLETGELLPDVFERWLDHDPARVIPRRPEGARALKMLWLDAGRRDEFRLHVGARRVRRAIEPLGIASRYFEHNGGHFTLNDRLDLSLPALAKALWGA